MAAMAPADALGCGRWPRAADRCRREKHSDKAVRLHAQLASCASKTFSQVDRLKRFINFIVDETVAGRGGDLKEYVIGVQVFGKEPSFDPRTDPIVRVQARRLRTRLARYYRDEGNSDELIVDLPKGGYAPVFRTRDDAPAAKRSLTATLVGRNTVAVLPLADYSAGASLDYFCRGLRDEIVHALTSIKALRVLAVAPRTSAEARRTRSRGRGAADHRQRSARRAIGCASRSIWSTARAATTCGPSRRTSTHADPVGGQEAIAKRDRRQARAGSVDADASAGARKPSDNLAARNLYLQGRYHLNQRTEEGLHKAVEFFEKAIVEDTQFSLAHSGLADALRPARALRRARARRCLGQGGVERRVRGDARRPFGRSAHLARARPRDAGLGLGRAPKREFQRAIQLNPRYPTAHHWYAMSCLVPMARLDEALEQMLLAQSLDPVSSIIARDVAVIQCYRRDFEAALEQCDHTIELNPHFAPAYLTLGMIQEQRKDFDESAAAFRRAVDLAPHSLRMQSALARTLALSGKRDRARRGAAHARGAGRDALRVAVRVRDDVICRRRSPRPVTAGSRRRATTAASSCSRSKSIRASTACATTRALPPWRSASGCPESSRLRRTTIFRVLKSRRQTAAAGFHRGSCPARFRTGRGCARRARRPPSGSRRAFPTTAARRCASAPCRRRSGTSTSELARAPVRIALDVGHGLHRHRRQLRAPR